MNIENYEIEYKNIKLEYIKNFMIEVLNLDYKYSDIFDSNIKIDYAYVDCIDELIIDDEEKNKLFKDVEVELKEKYNVVLNIIICYNIKENLGDYYEKSYITCNRCFKEYLSN